MNDKLSKLEAGIRDESERRVNTTLSNAKDAVTMEVYNKWYSNIFGITTDIELEETTKLVINALAGDLVSKEQLVEKVFSTAAYNLTKSALAR